MSSLVDPSLDHDLTLLISRKKGWIQVYVQKHSPKTLKKRQILLHIFCMIIIKISSHSTHWSSSHSKIRQSFLFCAKVFDSLGTAVIPATQSVSALWWLRGPLSIQFISNIPLQFLLWLPASFMDKREGSPWHSYKGPDHCAQWKKLHEWQSETEHRRSYGISFVCGDYQSVKLFQFCISNSDCSRMEKNLKKRLGVIIHFVCFIMWNSFCPHIVSWQERCGFWFIWHTSEWKCHLWK